VELRREGDVVGGKFKRRIKRGEYFPPFLYLSIINSCNLRCQAAGWTSRKKTLLTSIRSTADHRRQAARERFFGILGGEPFMHPQLLDLLAAHPDCYFQVLPTASSSPRKSRNDCVQSATPRRSSASRPRDHQRRATWEERRFNKTLRGLDHCLGRKSSPASHQRLPVRTSASC